MNPTENNLLSVDNYKCLRLFSKFINQFLWQVDCEMILSGLMWQEPFHGHFGQWSTVGDAATNSFAVLVAFKPRLFFKWSINIISIKYNMTFTVCLIFDLDFVAEQFCKITACFLRLRLTSFLLICELEEITWGTLGYCGIVAVGKPLVVTKVSSCLSLAVAENWDEIEILDGKWTHVFPCFL